MDERFARAAPALEIYATTQPRSFAVVKDDRGRDVTDRVRARDGQYVDTFGRGAYQGVTREHYLEVSGGRRGAQRRFSVAGWSGMDSSDG